jgi:polysaccharide biosynthesis transport protein
MSTSEPNAQPEISLRELLETLFRGKLIIIIITIVAILASGIYSFFFTPATYEANATLLANPFNFNTALANNTDSQVIDYLTKLPSMTIETYLHQVVSDDVLNIAIAKLDLRNPDGDYIAAGDLASSVKAANVAGTNLITITATNRDPEIAAKVANAMAASFIDFIAQSTKNQSQKAADLIAEQMVNEEKNLEQKSLALAEYQRNNRNIDVLKEEIKSLTQQIVQYRTDLNDAEKQMAADQAALQTLVVAIQNAPGLNIKDFTLSVQLNGAEEVDGNKKTSDPQLQLGLSTNQLSVALLQVELNKLQSSLIESTSEKTALVAKIDEINVTLTDDQIALTDQEYKYNALRRDVDMAESAYDAYLTKYKEAMLTVATNIGESSIQIMSPAIVPERPLSARRLFRVGVAAVLGLILGIFVVLFIDYWKKSKRAAV